MKRFLCLLLISAAGLMAQSQTLKPSVCSGVIVPAQMRALGLPMPPGPPLYQVMIGDLGTNVLAVQITVRYDQDGATQTRTIRADASPSGVEGKQVAYASFIVSESPLHVSSLIVQQLVAGESDEYVPAN